MEAKTQKTGRIKPKRIQGVAETAKVIQEIGDGSGPQAGRPTAVETAPPPETAATPQKVSQKNQNQKKKVTTFQRRRRGRLKDLVENFALVSHVCHLHVTGSTVGEICKSVKKKFPELPFKREDPYYIIRYAALQDMLVFRPPHQGVYRQLIHEWFPRLEVEVIDSADVEVVAAQAARVLLQMLRSFDADRDVVHVGLAGGHTLRAVMEVLARHMVEPVTDLPKVVHFHALAAGFNPEDPTTDPNSFVSLFSGKLVPSVVKFTGLSAPAIIGPRAFEELKGLDDIRDAFESVQNIDIFVTSGTTWHEDGSLRKRMPEVDRALLERLGIIGDVLWRPLSVNGPIEEPTSQRAFTLIELSQLKQFIRDGKKVLVTLAPCGLCGELKGNLLKGIAEQGLATHIVVDTRSAGRMLGQVS
jgi:DNA-binding transcriptional regulator LsrR (DeoR family)